MEVQRDLINVHKYVKEECKEYRARLLSEVSSARTRGSGHKLEHRRLHLTSRKHFHAGQGPELWHWDQTGCDPPWGSSEAAWMWCWVFFFEFSEFLWLDQTDPVRPLPTSAIL